ncbi:MAG: rhodanese-like domain-containing protein, partial [Hyphomicrobiales bacterium]|nr:rhodanese-like domain-containing protein [Hyphomicrobiales bacterium]
DDEFVAAVEDASCAIVDVREPHEFAAGHVPGAINQPLSSFDPAQLPPDQPVVLICQSGKRSLAALRAAKEAGRSDVRHYAPGTGGWRMRGGPVTL